MRYTCTLAHLLSTAYDASGIELLKDRLQPSQPLTCCVESIDGWLHLKQEETNTIPVYGGFSYLSSAFYLVKCYTYSVVTEDMVCLNICSQSFSLTKNVKVQLSR